MAGTQYTIFKQKIYVAPLGTVLPAMSVPYGGAWPTGWVRVQNTTEGAVITVESNTEDINSDENDLLGVVPAQGGPQVNIAFTSNTPDMNLMDFILQMSKQSVAADSTSGTPAFERHYIDPSGKQFMIGIEGVFPEGGLTDQGGFVRAFGYKVQQTDSVEVQFRTRGADAALQPAVNVRCLATVLEPAQTASTGITETDSKFDIFLVNSTS